MTAVQVANGSPFDSIRLEDEVGEYWSARDLMVQLGYDRWERFEDVIERAKAAINANGQEAPDHIRGAAKLVQIGLGQERHVIDYHLTRYGAYMIAMNGDPRKPEIAAAQRYFAVKTREAETRAPLSRVELAQMVIDEAARAELAEAKVAALEPAAESWSKLVDASGDYSVREAAQILSRDGNIKIGQRRLFDALRALGWISDATHCYQRHVDIGRVRLKTDTYYDTYTGEPHIRQQVRITPRGLGDLQQHLGGADSAMSLPTGT